MTTSLFVCEKYKVLHECAHGSFCKIYKTQNKYTNEIAALKVDVKI